MRINRDPFMRTMAKRFEYLRRPRPSLFLGWCPDCKTYQKKLIWCTCGTPLWEVGFVDGEKVPINPEQGRLC